MRFSTLHSWDLATRDARALQEELAGRVRLEPLAGLPETVAGADVSVRNERVYAAVILFRLADMKALEESTATGPSPFPYVPGLLSFREGPVLLEAFAGLSRAPDAVIFDGQGLAHPRRFGLACHLGLWLDLPSVGCAKSRLVGEHDEPGIEKGSFAPLRFSGRIVGDVLRSRRGVRPLYVSPGHKVDRTWSRRIVMATLGKYRITEPIRAADRRVGELARGEVA